MSELWKKLQEKLEKSGRKWSESDYISYRYAELFCEKCGKSLGNHDIIYTDLKTIVYCSECVKEYIRSVPFSLTKDKEVIFDNGNTITIKYKNNYYKDLITDKICYFNKKGRYIKIKGKIYYLNLHQK